VVRGAGRSLASGLQNQRSKVGSCPGGVWVRGGLSIPGVLKESRSNQLPYERWRSSAQAGVISVNQIHQTRAKNGENGFLLRVASVAKHEGAP